MVGKTLDLRTCIFKYLFLSLHPQPDVKDNKIPEVEHRVRPTINEVDIVQKSNEIPILRNEEQLEDYPSNVLMSHASEDSIFNKTEVLAGQYASLMQHYVVLFDTILFIKQ